MVKIKSQKSNGQLWDASSSCFAFCSTFGVWGGSLNFCLSLCLSSLARVQCSSTRWRRGRRWVEPLTPRFCPLGGETNVLILIFLCVASGSAHLSNDPSVSARVASCLVVCSSWSRDVQKLLVTETSLKSFWWILLVEMRQFCWRLAQILCRVLSVFHLINVSAPSSGATVWRQHCFPAWPPANKSLHSAAHPVSAGFGSVWAGRRRRD